MTTGIWSKDTTTLKSPCSINELIDNMEAVKKLAIALHSVWLEGDLLIDYTDKTFWGDNLNPLLVNGLENLGFIRRN